jgi:hypothetical protein
MIATKVHAGRAHCMEVPVDHPTQGVRKDSIQIKPSGAGRLIVRVSYSIERLAKIKTLVGRRWHQGEQCWTVPQH